jgi:hypothetical protein
VRRITDEESRLQRIKTATKRPRSFGQPFTRWSIRKLAHYLATKKGRKVVISRERLRQVRGEAQRRWGEPRAGLHTTRRANLCGQGTR